MKVAALFVDPSGTYGADAQAAAWESGVRTQVVAWGIERDARAYAGPHPVVAHPPCQRWGRFWHGSTRKPNQYKLGADNGCFAAALWAVRTYGGVLEHCADSLAWDYYGLARPERGGGWKPCDHYGGHTCYVEQGHYGHFSRKPTWLYACRVNLPELIWGPSEQRLHPTALAKYGYAKARRIGVVAMIGGKNKTAIRNATPALFRDALLAIACSRLSNEP